MKDLWTAPVPLMLWGAVVVILIVLTILLLTARQAASPGEDVGKAHVGLGTVG